MRRKNDGSILDLHNLGFGSFLEVEEVVFGELDRFLYPFLSGKKSGQVRIIVGRGLNSKRRIEGRNPMRYYTEKYLKNVGLTWRDGGYFDGQDGVLIIDFD